MHLSEQEFMTRCIRGYYQRAEITPPDVSRREFGFGWQDKIDYRHKNFTDGKTLKEFLVKEVPLYASYSLARYEFPSARPMPKKNFLGADLVFDLDTKYEHEGHHLLLCHYCLQRIAQDATRLKEEFLLKDFGFTEKEIITAFSGQKGFHIHVRSDAVQQLSSNARRELLEYISGNFDLAKMLSQSEEMADNVERKKLQAQGPTKDAKGWAKKIYDRTLQLFQMQDQQALQRLGFTKRNIFYIKKNQSDAIRHLENGKWDAFCSNPEEIFKNIAQEIRVATTVEIDKAVTYDVARLIRLPDSVHGSTGFAAKTLSTLDNFDPSKHCTITPNATATTKTVEDVVMTFADQTFELKANTPTEVPLALALFLACKHKTVSE